MDKEFQEKYASGRGWRELLKAANKGRFKFHVRCVDAAGSVLKAGEIYLAHICPEQNPMDFKDSMVRCYDHDGHIVGCNDAKWILYRFVPWVPELGEPYESGGRKAECHQQFDPWLYFNDTPMRFSKLFAAENADEAKRVGEYLADGCAKEPEAFDWSSFLVNNPGIKYIRCVRGAMINGYDHIRVGDVYEARATNGGNFSFMYNTTAMGLREQIWSMTYFIPWMPKQGEGFYRPTHGFGLEHAKRDWPAYDKNCVPEKFHVSKAMVPAAAAEWKPLSLDEVLGALDGIRKYGEYWKASCPCPKHDKAGVTLRIKNMSNIVDLRCDEGCDGRDIWDAIRNRIAKKLPQSKPKMHPVDQAWHDDRVRALRSAAMVLDPNATKPQVDPLLAAVTKEDKMGNMAMDDRKREANDARKELVTAQRRLADAEKRLLP